MSRPSLELKAQGAGAVGSDPSPEESPDRLEKGPSAATDVTEVDTAYVPKTVSSAALSDKSSSGRSPVVGDHARGALIGDAYVKNRSQGRVALLVLGMHRSGTSAVTRVLNLLGADLPSNLMPAIAGNNDAGCWESVDAFRLNNEILASAGSRWDDWRHFNPGWIDSPVKEELRHRALEILRQDFTQSSLFVLKDPQICRLMPFWLEVLWEFECTPTCVLTVRNPLEVAASLKKRDGFSHPKSFTLWLRHSLDAEMGSRGLSRVFVSYDGLLHDWRGTVKLMSNALGIAWPRRSATVEIEIDGFLTHKHRHHSSSDNQVLNHPDMTAWVKEVFAALKELEIKPDSLQALRALDGVRNEFDRATDALGSLLRAEEIARAELAATSNARISDLKTTITKRNNRISGLQKETASTKAMLTSTEYRRKELQSLTNKALRRLDTMQTSASWQLAKPLRAVEARVPGLVRGIAAATKIAWWIVRLHVFQQFRLRRSAGEILKAGLFDRAWYIATYPDVIFKGHNPIFHWISTGYKKGRDPNPLFDTDWYFHHNPDAARSGLDPLSHYLKIGAERRRDPHPDFDTAWYLQKYPDAARGDTTPLAYHLRVGARHGNRTKPIDVKMVSGGRKLRAQSKTILVCAHVAREHMFGGERSFVDLVKVLAEAAYNVRVILPVLVDDYLRLIRDYVIEIAQVPYQFWRDNKKPDPDLVDTIEDYLRSRKVDLVHVNTIMIREPLSAAKRVGIPSVVHVRESVLQDSWIAKIIGIPAPAIIDKVVASANYIVANSPVTAEEFNKQGATFLAPNSFDLAELDIENRVDPKRIRVGLISSNIPKKGLDDFANLAKACAPVIPNLEFLMIGPYNKHVVALESRKQSGDLPECLHFIDYQPTPLEAIQKVNIVVNLSHFSESFGRTVAEGLGARRPAIVYDYGFPKHLVQHGETGFVLPFRAWSSAIPILDGLCKEPEQIRVMGERGRKFLQAHYAKETAAEALLDAYRRIFRQPKARTEKTTSFFLPAGPGLADQVRGEINRFEKEGGPIEIQTARALTRPTQAISDKPLRVAYFLWHFPVPSETFVLNELRLLVTGGHDVKVFCSGSPYPDFHPDFDVAWERVSDAEALAKRLRETDRQIVHAHFTYPTVTDRVWPAAEMAGLPFTFIAHAQDIFRFKNDQRNRISEIARSRHCIRVFTLSRFHRDYLIERGVPAEKIFINPNSIDPSLFDLGLLRSMPEKEPGIFNVSRFVEKKGIPSLLKAAKLLEMDGINVFLYGYGPQEQELRSLANEIGCSNLFLRGPVQGREQLLEIFARHDLLVCPSTRASDGDMDGIPTVLIEAMASGVPVMATRIAGIPDLVREGHTGFVCGEAPAAIADAVRRFYATPNIEVAALATEGRARVEDRFNARKLTANLLQTWRDDPLDVVLVSWNNLPQLREVITRLYRFTRVPFHLIVCDNASDQNVRKYLKELHASRDNVTIVYNSVNARVGPGTNIATAQGWGKYVAYVCGKEGFVLSEGWDTALARYMDESPKMGMAGTICTSPTYLRGADYPTGIPVFAEFRNRGFAVQNANREFSHIQGGFFVMRRSMLEEIGGFNSRVPHEYTDVEMSFYAESCGYEIGQAPHLLALYNKTRPDLWSRIDEDVYAVHPPQLEDLPALDRIVSGDIVHCNLCGRQGEPGDAPPFHRCCPSCGSTAADRSLWRYLAASNVLYRRLPALAIGHLGALEKIWTQQFQGKILDPESFADMVGKGGGGLGLRTGGLSLIFLRCEPEINQQLLVQAQTELMRVMASDARYILQDTTNLAERDCSKLDALAQRLPSNCAIVDRPVYRSVVVGYDPSPMVVAQVIPI